MIELPRCHLKWRPSYRIIPSRYPPINLFERVADPADLEAVIWVESLTNDRLRDEIGELQLVAKEDRVTGPGTTPIMAAFTHRNPLGSRFSDGSYGVYYASKSQETAVYETIHHYQKFLGYSHEKPMELQMRVYLADLDAHLHDIRGMQQSHPQWYGKDDYGEAQRLGQQLRDDNAWGLVYDSVRHPGGECVAVFRPPVLAPCRQGAHLAYLWNGERITNVIERRDTGMTLV